MLLGLLSHSYIFLALLILAPILIVYLNILLYRKNAPRRDMLNWQIWENYLANKTIYAAARHARFYALGDYAKTGLKGYIQFLDTQETSGVWFKRGGPKIGSQLLIFGHFWGTIATHHNEIVFHVHMYYEIPVYAEAGWQRHNARITLAPADLWYRSPKILTWVGRRAARCNLWYICSKDVR